LSADPSSVVPYTKNEEVWDGLDRIWLQQPAVPVIGVLSAQVFRGARVIVGDGRVIDDASSFGCWPSRDTVRISGRLRITNAYESR
jgi:hypothetical protein